MNQVKRKVSLYKLAKHIDNAGRVLGEPAVVLNKTGHLASIKFNRPRFFNCIDGSIITPMSAFLSSIITENNTNIVTIEGSSHRNRNHAFTTGGDLLMGLNIIYRKEKYDAISNEERLYLVNIYRTQHYLYELAKNLNVISLMDGTSMGSGVLFGLNSTFSVATERTVWSLPEVVIGGMPDVGVIFHMNKLGDNLGTMLALTGHKLIGTDVVHSGVATHFCKSEKIEELKKEIENLEKLGTGKEELKRLLDHFHEDSIDTTKESEKTEQMSKLRDMTNHNYDSANILEIFENLKMSEDVLSQRQLKSLSKACPLSLRVTLRLIQELSPSNTSFDWSLVRSYKVAGNIYFCKEMKIGIETAMVFRGKKMPRWRMPSVEEVPEVLVDYVFENEFKENVLTLEQLRDLDTTKAY